MALKRAQVINRLGALGFLSLAAGLFLWDHIWALIILGGLSLAAAIVGAWRQ